MNTYSIYLSDAPNDPIKGRFPSITEARKAARLYIKQWVLSASILKVEEEIDPQETVIIASKRKGKKMWEGYTEVLKTSHKEELSRLRSMGRACKVFANMNEYRADVNRILDSLEGR